MNPEADARWIIRAGLTVIIGGVLAFGGWAALAPLSGAVIAPGYVKVDLNRKVVQHQEGGIVRAIRVRDGAVDLFGSRAEVLARVTRPAPALVTREVA